MNFILNFQHLNNRYLIHHFNFETNDDLAVGQFKGNYSLNKFMSLHDWRLLFEHLDETIQNYLKKPKTKPITTSIDVTDSNMNMAIEWSKLDSELYGQLFRTIDFSEVFPFVMSINVAMKSNLNQFKSSTPPTVTKPTTSKNGMTTATALRNDVRELRIIIPRLQVDENGKFINEQSLIQNNKRKHRSLNDTITPLKMLPPKRLSVRNSTVSCSSTPYVPKQSRMPEANLSNISIEINDNNESKKTNENRKLKPRLTKTPQPSKRKDGSKRVKKKIQVSIGQLTSKPKKSVKGKKTTATATVAAAKKKKPSMPKSKRVETSSDVQSIDTDESDVFQKPKPVKRTQNSNKENNGPTPETNGNDSRQIVM